jgi:hypothetical protein
MRPCERPAFVTEQLGLDELGWGSLRN